MTDLNLTEPGAPPRASEPATAFADLRDALGELLGRLAADGGPDRDEWIDYADHLAYGSQLARRQTFIGEQPVGDPAIADLSTAMLAVGHMLVDECGRIVVHPPPARRILAMAEHVQKLAKVLRGHVIIDVTPD